MQLITEETVWLEIYTRLKNSSSLDYIKKIYEGERMVNTDDNLPYIIMEWFGDEETWTEFPKSKMNVMTIHLRGVLPIKTKLDNQIVGDDEQVGALRLKHDVMKAFEGADFRISDNLIKYDIRMLSTQNKNDALREVTLELVLSFKFFQAESRT